MMPSDPRVQQTLPPAAATEAATGAEYSMRPLTTGEILDRTFSIYRSRFWLFAGISALSGAVQVIANAISLTGQRFVMTRYGFVSATRESLVGSMIGGVLFLLAAAVTQAATVHALSEVYLGRAASVGASLRVAATRWYRYMGIAVWQLWSAIWLVLLIAAPAMVLLTPRFGFRSLAWLGGVLIFLAIVGGSIYGAIAYLRNSLAVPASVVEQSTMRASMRRSKVLSKGTKGRIFVVLLVAGALYWVGGAIQAPVAFFIMRAPMQTHVIAQAVLLAVGFATHTFVSPVALIGLALVYFDQRVRMEALDLMLLLGGDTASAFGTAVPAEASTAGTRGGSAQSVPAGSAENNGSM